MKKSHKKTSSQRSNVEALLTENRRLQQENHEVNDRFQKLGRLYFLQTKYIGWLEQENKRFHEHIHNGALAMMNYSNFFQN